MPYGDGTGPAGFGPMTGRSAGFCAGFSAPGYVNPAAVRGFLGRGRGIGLGRGRGFRNRLYMTGLPLWARYDNQNMTISNEEEINILKNQAKFMQDEMNAINERIKELDKDALIKKEKQ